jgi:hypothetical protein
VRGAKPGPPRSPQRESPRRKCPLARTLRARQRLGVGAAPVSAHDRRGQNDGKLLTVKIRQPSHEFTFGVGMNFILYPLVLTPVV